MGSAPTIELIAEIWKSETLAKSNETNMNKRPDQILRGSTSFLIPECSDSKNEILENGCIYPEFAEKTNS
jgi:hypothetical protein